MERIFLTAFFLGETHQRGNACLVICFILLADVLRPIVESAYRRVRACRVWKILENGEWVDVTEYPRASELLDCWGSKWNTAKMVALIMLVFSGLSWALEMSLRLINIRDGPVDRMNRPPPVFLPDGREDVWEVSPMPGSRNKLGTFNNFEATKDTVDGEILSTGRARSVYRTPKYGRLGGVTVMAEWSTSVIRDTSSNSLYYDSGGETSTLTSLNCGAGGAAVKELRLQDGGRWGDAIMCDAGPSKLCENQDEAHDAPATIILQKDATNTFLIVEEKSNFPDFFYSVWTVTEENTSWSADTKSDNTMVPVRLLFYVGSSFRMVEAIITGIANDVLNGGGCVDLMLEFSRDNETYLPRKRAKPFGEHPGQSGGVVERLDAVEPIEKGLEIDFLGIICLSLLVVFTAAGIGSSVYLKSSMDIIDIFDRDALIIAAALHGQAEALSSGSRSTFRILARKVKGDIYVGISKTQETEKIFGWWLRRPRDTPKVESALAVCAMAGSSVNNSASSPKFAGGGSLEFIREAHGRSDFARGFGPRSQPASPLSLSPSPSSSSSSPSSSSLPSSLSSSSSSPWPSPPGVPSSATGSSSTAPTARRSPRNPVVPESPATNGRDGLNPPLAIGARWRTRYASYNFNRILSVPRHPWRLIRHHSSESSTSSMAVGESGLPCAV